ncbi:hypothetical protein CIT25_33395 [Mesorhizobium mediterraneum]|uniref:Uncharacterized protein n=1 Tax=Mesorhizobium mediterraneum TaxID=43617 RepID=A0AB36R012_9HYPH|nr:hypothetical protein CIT25_33395 [Mesorhizobium mediterraneum]
MTAPCGRGPSIDGRLAAFKAAALDFGPQLRPVALAFLPAQFEIVLERIQDRSRGWPPVLGLTARGKPALDRPHVHAHPWRDLARRHAGGAQLQDFRVEFTALVSPRAAQAIKLRATLYR